MKEKFTPGPWITESTRQTPNGLDELIRSANNTHIGWAYSPENASLIAAAPDLYENLVDRYTQTKCGCGHPSCNRCADDRETENVLARARGE